MALSARDLDRPPIYFGGWEFLAGGLGWPRDDVDDPEPYPPAAKRAVARAVSELVAIGAVKSYGAAGRGHNVTYELRI